MNTRNGKSRRKKRSWKPVLLLAAFLLLFAAGGTVAFMVQTTDSITNTFLPSGVSCEVSESFTNGVKNAVKVKNTGDIDAYIRAAVVVTWKDSSGKVYAQKPVEGTDYTVSWTKSGWSVGSDGYYYHTSRVAPDGLTGELLTGCQELTTTTKPSGYSLSVDIIASAIQAEPESVVQEVWGVTVSNGVLTP